MNVVANELGDQRLGTLNDGIDVDRPHRLLEQPRLRHDLRCELGAPVRSLLDRADVLEPRMSALRGREKAMRVRADNEEQVAQVVRRPCSHGRRRCGRSECD